jgi:hypothetical protein
MSFARFFLVASTPAARSSLSCGIPYKNQIGVKIVRHFNRPNTKIEREEFNVSLNNVSCIELKIVCDIGGKGRASLRELFIG